jgi:electron transfer flavoprotein alpha subunit
MKKSEFIVAINTDKDAPIGEIADVLVVADLKQFVPTLTEKLKVL